MRAFASVGSVQGVAVCEPAVGASPRTRPTSEPQPRFLRVSSISSSTRPYGREADRNLPAMCPDCYGSGEDGALHPCSSCHGDGVMSAPAFAPRRLAPR